jgi:hypothetical protein
LQPSKLASALDLHPPICSVRGGPGFRLGHHQAPVAPEGVNLEAADLHIDLGYRNTEAFAEPEKPLLQSAARARELGPVHPHCPPQGAAPGLTVTEGRLDVVQVHEAQVLGFRKRPAQDEKRL